MYQRDLIVAEIQKLAQTLAKIIGLKLEEKIEEAQALTEKILSEELIPGSESLNTISPEDFESGLHDKQYSAEKLDLISKLIFESVSPFEQKPEHRNRFRLILVIYDVLEKVHHTQSFNNLATRSAIEKFLNTGHHE